MISQTIRRVKRLEIHPVVKGEFPTGYSFNGRDISIETTDGDCLNISLYSETLESLEIIKIEG